MKTEKDCITNYKKNWWILLHKTVNYVWLFMFLYHQLHQSQVTQEFECFVWLSVTLYHCCTRFEKWKKLWSKFVAPIVRLYHRLHKIFECFVWLSVTLYHCYTRFENWKTLCSKFVAPFVRQYQRLHMILNILSGFMLHCITVTPDFGKFVSRLLGL